MNQPELRTGRTGPEGDLDPVRVALALDHVIAELLGEGPRLISVLGGDPTAELVLAESIRTASIPISTPWSKSSLRPGNEVATRPQGECDAWLKPPDSACRHSAAVLVNTYLNLSRRRQKAARDRIISAPHPSICHRITRPSFDLEATGEQARRPYVGQQIQRAGVWEAGAWKMRGRTSIHPHCRRRVAGRKASIRHRPRPGADRGRYRRGIGAGIVGYRNRRGAARADRPDGRCSPDRQNRG